MRFVDVHEAKTQLSRLIKAVEAGEEVVIQAELAEWRLLAQFSLQCG